MQQLAAVEAVRDAAFAAGRTASTASVAAGTEEKKRATGHKGVSAAWPCGEAPGARLMRLRGAGPRTASALAGKAVFRDVRTRREAASDAGLPPSPRQSGGIGREQGISKAGNARVRRAMAQLARPWQRNQPDRALSVWSRERVRDGRAGSSASPSPHSRASCRRRCGGSSPTAWREAGAGGLRETARPQTPIRGSA